MAVGKDGGVTRTWLAQVVDGASPTWPFEGGGIAAKLVEAADEEGVVVMVNWQLRQSAARGDKMEVPSGVREAFASAARSAALVSMILQAETATVLRSMASARTPGLLLKGTALAHWAYQEPHWRACNDVDVLLPSREAAEAVAADLERHGYERLKTSGELVAYELMCRRLVTDKLKAEIDIHWALSNSALFADVFSFDELMAESIPVPALGPNARALGPVHACFHACVHRVRNLSNGVPDRLKWLYDIVKIVEPFDASNWNRLVALAERKRFAGVVLGGLEAATSAFGRPVPQDVVTALRCAQGSDALDASRLTDWRYMQRMTFMSLPTFGLRIRWIWQRVFPSRAYMNYLYGDADRSYVTLVAQRLRRLVVRLTRSRRPLR